MGTLQVLGSLGCMLVMKTLGKRGLSFISMSVCVICAVSLVIYILLDLFSPWIPMVLFCLLFFTAQLGIGSIPWMLISEVFPIQYVYTMLIICCLCTNRIFYSHIVDQAKPAFGTLSVYLSD